MDAYTNIDSQVLLVTARVKAALDVVPRIVGPKEAWETWLRNGLQSEIKKVPKASPSSPWPSFLMRVNTVLCMYYYSAMQISTFNIDEVQLDDPSLMGDEFVDLPLDALPDPTGDDLWWKKLPPSVSLKESMPPPSLLEPPAHNERPPFSDKAGTASSTRKDTQSQHEPKRKRKVQVQLRAPAPREAPISPDRLGAQTKAATTSNTTNQASNHHATPDIRTSGTTSGAPAGTSASTGPSDSAPVRNLKRSECTAKEDSAVRPPKKKKKKSSTMEVFSSEENDIQAGPSTASSLKGNGEVEASKVCDACKSHALTCVWPVVEKSSASRNEKRACSMCSLQKIRCEISGVFSIRPPRGKRGESRSSPPRDQLDGLIQQVTLMSECIAALEKTRVSNALEKERLATSISLLELQVSRLKKAKSRS